MKKSIMLTTVFSITIGLFAQSADYSKYLNQAKKYEAEKKWCFALGSYYDALATDDEPELKQEAYDGYKELQNAIVNGNPGKGKFNAFSIHDEWKKLLIDAEKYGSSINKFELTIGDLVQGDLNYETKTASYSATVKKNISDRYVKTVNMVKRGYSVAYKEDWSSDLPVPKEWPLTSVSSNKNGVYNVNGALIMAVERIDWYGNSNKYFWNAFAVDEILTEETLFDYKFNVIDESGKEVVKAKRFLLGREKSIVFEGVKPEVMDLIDNGKAFVKPVAVYLEYGKYNPEDDKGGRSFIKNFPEVTLNVDNAVFYGTNQKGDVKVINIKNVFGVNAINDLILVAIPGRNFLVSTTEVTQVLYEGIMGENPSHNKDFDNPVESVSWFDAIYFCNKLSEISGKSPAYSVNGSTDTSTWGYIPHKGKSISGTILQNQATGGYRLPTENEWEYAARGGENYKYSGSDNLDEIGWYSDNSNHGTHPVAQKKANGYGLYDMSGNVCEWCWDSKGSDSRYYRGGSYRSYGFNGSCGVSSRSTDYADGQNNDGLGFRIVCSTSN